MAAVVREYIAAAHGSDRAPLSQQQPLMEAGLDSLDLLKACAALAITDTVPNTRPNCVLPWP